jgi:hypothetical protein
MFLNSVINNKKENSWVNSLRRKRFAPLGNFIRNSNSKVKILDIGGTVDFWKNLKLENSLKIEVTLLNLQKEEVPSPIFRSLVGDAMNLEQFNDREFDIIFSNSTIEHLGDYENQKKAASEITRVGKGYYIQTPNLNFPIEPHFLFPLFQFFPLKLKLYFLLRFNLGWIPRQNSEEEALALLNSIRLLNKCDLRKLFPDANILQEKVFFLTKSFVAYKFPYENY